MSNKLYDKEKFMQAMNNDSAFAKQMADLFVAKTPEDLTSLVSGWSEKDRKRTSELAHKMKSGIKLFGMTQAFDLAQEIEMGAKSDMADSLIDEKVTRFSELIYGALHQLKSESF